MEAKDVREMRARIFAAARGAGQIRVSDDGGTIPVRSTSATIAAGVVHMGALEGWSGEDVMTVLAYRALEEVERLFDRLIEMRFLDPSQPMITPQEGA